MASGGLGADVPASPQAAPQEKSAPPMCKYAGSKTVRARSSRKKHDFDIVKYAVVKSDESPKSRPKLPSHFRPRSSSAEGRNEGGSGDLTGQRQFYKSISVDQSGAGGTAVRVGAERMDGSE